MANEDGNSQALVKAQMSISKAQDVRKETELRMKSYANWEEFLMPAPISIAILGQLVFISAGQGDFSINKNPPKDGFKHIRYPESFRACLCQVSNQGWQAFNTAHVNMDQIRLLSMSVPERMTTIVKILFQDMEVVNAMLPTHLQNIKAVADDCQALAQAVKDKYSDVIYLIQELMEACLNAKKGYEDELKDIQIALQQAKIKEAAAKKAQELAEQYHREMKKQVDESYDEYRKAMDAIPIGWDAVGMGLVESITTSISNTVTGVKSIFMGIAHRFQNEKMEDGASADPEQFDSESFLPALRIFGKSEMLLIYTTELKNLIDEQGHLHLERVYNEKNQQFEIDWLIKSFQEVKRKIKGEKDCKPKKRAEKICTSGIHICERLKKMALSQNKENAKEKSLIDKIKRLYQKASEFDSRSKSSTGSPAFAAKAPNMAKCQQNTKGGSVAMQNAYLKVEQSRGMLRSTQDEYQRSYENFKKQNEELMEIMCAMEKCNVQEIDFKAAKEMLIKGLEAMGKVKEQWEKMVRFFQMISSLIDSCLSRDIKEFVSSVSDVQKIENYSSKSFVKDIIYTQAFNASSVAHLVHMIAETYTEVSNNYLMDRVSSLGRLIAMEASDPKFTAERVMLQTGCEEARQAIYNLVKKKKEEFDRNVEARVETIDKALKAVLPPVSVEEQKAIEGAVQQGLKELTEEEADQFGWGSISWHLPMALLTCSGEEVGYKGIVRGHVEEGMREVVCFTQYLLKVETDPDAHGKIQEQIAAASRELSAAEEELGRQLNIIDASSEELLVKKKTLQEEKKEKKLSLENLRIQLDSCHESERKAIEMLENAKRHLNEMQAEVQKKKDEAWRNQLTRDIGIGLMFIPVLGTLAGSIMVGCGHVAMEAAQKAANEAQEAVNRHTDEESRFSAEVRKYNEQERQMKADITANEKQLDQIELEQQALAEEQQEIVALQSELRKCVTFVNGLAGKVRVAKRLTEDLLIYEELANILGDMVHHMLPLMSPNGKGGLGFLATREIQGVFEDLRSCSHDLKALADVKAAAIEY